MRNSFFFYPKLAASNLKKNSKTYVPYLISGIFCAAVYYILRSLALNPSIREGFGGGAIHSILQMGGDVSAIFIIVLLFYTSSFLMKQRKKEFALLNTLGMGKHHIARMLAFEALYSFLITVSGGLVLGLALDKVSFLVISKFLHNDVTLGFFIAPPAIVHVLLLYVILNVLIFVKTVWTLHVLNPAELLREGKAGEKEPKAKWVLAVLGVLALGGGYGIALTAENPLKAIPAFFVAVLLVILGTFLLFTAGSIALLKLLRKNKKYYYKTNHFVSVSGLMYRMKQNAVGLASICILSTMVLVMISSTGSLMLGLEDMLQERYPNDFNCEISEADPERQEELISKLHELQEGEKLPVEKEISYHYLNFAAAKKGDEFVADTDYMTQSLLMLVPIQDYNRATGECKTLQDGELLVRTKRLEWNAPTVDILGNSYRVKEHISVYPDNGDAASNIADCLYLVCTESDFEKLYDLQKDAYGPMASEYKFYYGFNTSANDEAQNNFRPVIRPLFDDYAFTCESRLAERASFTGLFGGLFFIGIFLGLLFTMATVLIVYYKQISEGYEDKERFHILQKVGMSEQEVKKTIHSQVLTVFFLPLLFAGLHLSVAFPILNTLLKSLGLMKTSLFFGASLVSYLVFAAFYVAVYFITARTYYRIVKR